MDKKTHPIQARAEALTETIERYVKEAEAVHGEIDREDGDLWDLLAYKAALELWGQPRILKYSLDEMSNGLN